jgi:hypothetical protein
VTTIDEIIQGRQRARGQPSNEDLRRLPDRKAFINGRVSSPNQIIQSGESIREIAYLVDLAKQDGFKTNLSSSQAEQWLERIQAGTELPGVIEDGEVIVDCQDLGRSGTLGEDERLGLAHLNKCLEAGEIGAIYVTEGVSRLSRDPDRIIPRTLLKLMKQSNCKLRTPEEVLNPCIERDWQQVDEDFEQAAKELTTFRKRLHDRKMKKSERGENVGAMVPPGFYLPITGQRSDGSYIFGKLALYQPHAEVNIIALKELLRWRSKLLAARALRAKHIVYPFFPSELSYMNTRSSIKRSPRIKGENGWAITPEVIRGLATNLKQAGIWISGDKTIKDNHPAVFSGELLDLWMQAYEIVHKGEPQHRITECEPMPFAGLFYCTNHGEPSPISSNNTEDRLRCAKGYNIGAPICLDVTSHIVIDPLTQVFLERFNPFPYVEAMLRQAEQEMKQGNLEGRKLEQDKKQLKQRIANLRDSLGYEDRRKDEILLEEITKAERALSDLERRARESVRRNPLSIDVGKIREFLWRLWQNWDSYPNRLKNEIIYLFIEGIELHHERKLIEATIVWKSGERQVILIDRPRARFAREMRWGPEEDNLVRMLWPSSSREAILAAFPERSWKAIMERAARIGVNRERKPYMLGAAKHWTEHEKSELKRLYEGGVPIPEISAQLGRGQTAIVGKASVLKLRRPREVKWKRLEPTWRQPMETLKGSKAECLERLPLP